MAVVVVVVVEHNTFHPHSAVARDNTLEVVVAEVDNILVAVENNVVVGLVGPGCRHSRRLAAAGAGRVRERLRSTPLNDHHLLLVVVVEGRLGWDKMVDGCYYPTSRKIRYNI